MWCHPSVLPQRRILGLIRLNGLKMFMKGEDDCYRSCWEFLTSNKSKKDIYVSKKNVWTCFNSGSLFVRRGHAFKLIHLLFLYLDVCTQPWASRWVWPSFSTLVLHFFSTHVNSIPFNSSFSLFSSFAILTLKLRTPEVVTRVPGGYTPLLFPFLSSFFNLLPTTSSPTFQDIFNRLNNFPLTRTSTV